ncbi:hypothetical protein D5F01_LYC15626 [Larimichthys crocea]|uniref:Ig-like domain-containing protein n=1 Tax=Larimichthys crocea TaxID=215358 RepID=A0A6G0I3M6_LARCR|nr:hypothetical protein D5F01_LYC15626 [Larimichthys crocea]
MRVSCSSEGGDSPQYSWTLDGHTLTDTQLLSRNNETNNIILRQDVSGQLTCSVKNHVSTVSKTKTISTCGFIFIDCISNGTHISKWVLKANNTLCIETTTTPTSTMTTEGHIPIIAGVLSALVILLVVGVALVCVHQKKQKNKPKEEDDEQELTYADVRIVQRQGRQIQQVAEVDVEYGQVKFSGRPRQTVKQTEDACVYAMVRKGR